MMAGGRVSPAYHSQTNRRAVSCLAARLFLGLGKSGKSPNDGPMFFWRPKDKDPKAPLLEDIRSFWTDEQPHRWKFIFASLALTGIMVAMMTHDFRFRQPYKDPEIEWVTSFDKNRTTAQMKADQARFAEEARIEEEADTREREERKAAYRRLAKGFGLPVVNDKPSK